MVTIGFSREAYSVSEEAGSVSVTLSIQNGNLDRDLITTLSTVNGTALCEYLKLLYLNGWFHYQCVHCLISPAGVDYEAVTTNLTFSVSTQTQVVTLPILDDLIVENYETFGVTLTTFDTAATLRSQTNSVTIRDNNDSKLHCIYIYIMLFESLVFVLATIIIYSFYRGYYWLQHNSIFCK